MNRRQRYEFSIFADRLGSKIDIHILLRDERETRRNPVSRNPISHLKSRCDRITAIGGADGSRCCLRWRDSIIELNVKLPSDTRERKNVTLLKGNRLRECLITQRNLFIGSNRMLRYYLINTHLTPF